MMAPIFEEVVIENKNKSIIFGKVDVEKYKKFAGENNVQSIPTIIMFDNQQHEIKRSQGYLSKNNLLKFILANES